MMRTCVKQIFILSTLFFLPASVFGQRTINGIVSDSDSRETLIGATILVVNTTKGAVTDIDGKFTLEIPEGSDQIRISYVGYNTQMINIGLQDSFIQYSFSL